MGRRAKKAPVQTKKKVKLAKLFKCPFCANEDTVECKMDFKMSIGSLNCRVCGASYQMPIHHLHEPIDVFSEWLDDCEAAANPNSGGGGGGAGGDAAEARYGDEAVGDEDSDDELPSGSGLASSKKPAAKASGGGNQRSVDLGLSSDEDD